jgi:ribosome-associated protein
MDVESSFRIGEELAGVLRDKHAEDVIHIDVSECSGVTDVFLVASATSEVQMNALLGAVEDALDERKELHRTEGETSSRWRLVDAGGVVVHLFSREARDYYRLERLFPDAPIRRYESVD